MRPVELVEGEKPIENPVVQATLTKRYTERALEFIDANKDQPFFLYLPHTAVHLPLRGGDEFFGESEVYYDEVIGKLAIARATPSFLRDQHEFFGAL